MKCPRVSGLRKPIDGNAAGKPDVVVLGHLVKGFPARVVDRRPENLDHIVPFDPRDDRVAAGNQEAEVGILDVTLQVRRVEVREDVIDADKGFAQCPGQPLGIGKSDEQGPDQPRTEGHGNGVDVLFAGRRFLQRVFDHGPYPLDVLPRGDLGHHAVVGPVEVNLAQDDVAENPPPVLDDRRRAFITGAFDAEKPHRAVPLSRARR